MCMLFCETLPRKWAGTVNSVGLWNLWVIANGTGNLQVQLWNRPQLFRRTTVPEWHCAAWYSPLHGFLKSRIASTKLPSDPDLFLDKFGNELGEFSWSHWLCATDKLQQHFSLETEI